MENLKQQKSFLFSGQRMEGNSCPIPPEEVMMPCVLQGEEQRMLSYAFYLYPKSPESKF